MQWLETRAADHGGNAGDDPFDPQRQDPVASCEAAAARDPHDAATWARLAQAYLSRGQIGEALVACERGQRLAPSGAIHFVRGHSLAALGRREQAVAEFERSMALGDGRLGSLKALLRLLAPNPDGMVMLAFCDRLEPRYRDTAVTRAYRAIALSRLGRTAEAAALVDLDRHVVRQPVSPPAGFENLETFNRALADEILVEPSPTSHSRARAITYGPQIGPALAALRGLTRHAIDAYLERRDELGMAVALPGPPAAGRLQTVTTVLRRDGRNRQHIHPRGYVSTVYHVQLPEAIRNTSDDRGALVLGVCDEATKGYQACWGVRRLRPIEGWLTLFPSHVFHDVVPSLVDEPRISVASDLCPA